MSLSPAAGPDLFIVERVTFVYRGTTAQVLASADLRLPRGRRICVVGRNGSGKSTLLYLLGLLCEARLQHGRITCHLPGHDPIAYDQLTPAARNELRGQRFGFVLQDAYLLPQLTCLENLALPLLLQGTPPEAALARAAALLREAGGVDLAALADRRVDTLSGGQRRMMGVLRAILHDPDVVFADEPTQSLDVNYAPRVLNLLDAWQRAGAEDRPRTLVMVLHEPAVIHERADAVVVLGPGGPRQPSPIPLAEIERKAQADGISPTEQIRRWISE
ncbi:MAG: ATP-binding cassette domain-containing protein [Gemmataceae bacterium]